MKPIPDCPGYFADDDGAIWSENRGRTKKLRPFDRKKLDGTSSPYLSVCLLRNGKRCNRFVHDVVALAYHGPRPSADHEVRHLDGNGKNNRPDNLKWGTQEENTEDRYRHDAWGRAWARRRATMPPDPPNAHDGEAGDGHAFSDLAFSDLLEDT